eukprot:2275263-Prymnesium_polylepis.1
MPAMAYGTWSLSVKESVAEVDLALSLSSFPSFMTSATDLAQRAQGSALIASGRPRSSYFVMS